MRVAIYCRLSEEDKNKPNTADSESIQNQKSMLVQYSTDREWEIYNIYSDDDYTGADRERPEFKKLLIDAENKKFDIILCKTQSRFTRELEIVEKYIHNLFIEWGIRFISIVDNADTDIKGNKKARQINGLINEWYLEDLSENIKSVLKNKMKQGYYIGSTALYGYIKDPNKKGHLIIDEEAAEIVRRVFNLYDKDYGKSTIARILNEQNIPNPTEYKKLKGIAYKIPPHKAGTLWKYFAIADMLVNPMYIGSMVQGRYGSVSYKSKKNKPTPKEDWIIIENTHEPIIDNDLWERVQIKIKSNFKPFIATETSLFTKKVRCLYCGYIMRSGKSRGIRYLKCGTKHIAKNACIGSYISYKKLTEIIKQQIDSFIDCYLDKNALEENVNLTTNQHNKKAQIEADIKIYENKINNYTKGINEAYFDKIKGVIDEDEFIAVTKEFREQKSLYQKMTDEATKKITVIDENNSVLRDKKQIIDEFISDKELNRIIVNTLIDNIKVGKNNRKTKEQPIEITWNF